MNTSDPRLHDLFEEQSHGVRVSVGDLAERAIALDRRHRRREIAGVAMAGVLALSIALPFGWNALGPNRASQVPAGTNPPAVSTQVAPSPTQSAGPATPAPTITLTGSPAAATLTPSTDGSAVSGQGTAVAYAVDGVFHDGDRAVRLPAEAGQPTGVARLADGAMLVVSNMAAAVVDGSGKLVKRLPDVYSFAVADDLAHFVMSDQLGNLSYRDARGEQVSQLAAETCKCAVPGGAPSSYAVVGLIGTTAYATKGSSGSSAAWDVETGRVADLSGVLTVVDPVRRTAIVRSGGDVGQRLCQELRDLSTGGVWWRLCGPVLLQSFSSDGQYLVGTGSIDGLRDEQLGPDGKLLYGHIVVVRAADGAVVLGSGDPTGPGPWSRNARVATGDDIAVEVGLADGMRSLQRCTLDGSCAVLAPARPPVQPDVEGTSTFVLSEN